MEDNELPKREFVREKIKDKPLNKKRIACRIGISAVCGLVFGLAACGIFALLLPKIANRQPGTPVGTESESQSVSAAPTEPAETTSPEPLPVPGTEIDIEVELTLEDYQKLQDQLYDVGKKANRSIVAITSVVNSTDIFHNIYETEGQGSGVIIEDNGAELLILTERKVISDASRVSVTFIDDTTVDSAVKKFDGNTGIAILTVDKKQLEPATLEAIDVAEFGISQSVSGGNMVIALGSPLGTTYSILTGNITSTNNEISTEDHNFSIFTTDIVASENGSGVLVNVKGQVIGVVMQEYGAPQAGNTLTAVAVSDLKPTINHLSNGKDIPYFGLRASTVTAEIEKKYNMPKGVYIREVTVDSPAMHAGLQSGDVMIRINGQNVLSVESYSSKLLELTPGETVPVVVKRQGANGYSEVTCQVQAGVLP